jgi:hypothetical protein
MKRREFITLLGGAESGKKPQQPQAVFLSAA